MIAAESVTFDLVFILLVAAIVLFVLDAFWSRAPEWFRPLGLACFAAGMLVELKNVI